MRDHCAWSDVRRYAADVYSMTQHVECVALLVNA